MITIVGTQEVAEYRAAARLRSLIQLAWPDVADSARDRITIVVAAKCYGCSTQDIDLVVIGNLAKPRTLPSLRDVDGERVILSFVWTIELKSHPAEKVQFMGAKVLVPYGAFMKDASEQAFRQQSALRDYLKRNIGREPFCQSLIWLEGCRMADVPRIDHINVLAADSNWDDFLRAAAGQQISWLKKSPQNRLLQAFNLDTKTQYQATIEVCDLFSRPVSASHLDRKKVERITQRVIADQLYAEKLGLQLLIFRGRGGTGKTMTLVRLALDLHLNRLSRVLLLTYNVALVSDIRRTLAIIGACRDSDGPVVQVRTVHSFMLELMKQADIIDAIDESALRKYEHNLAELLELVAAFSDDDLPQFDFVFIDEAQDWPEQERDIVFRVFGPKRTIVADGVDQLVRSKKSTNWTSRIGNTPKQIVPLRKSLRLKHTITRFANALAEELGLLDWSLQENPELSGGRVTVLIGPAGELTAKLTAIVKAFQDDGNAPVDSLVCVPYTSALSTESGHVMQVIQRCGFSVWDGTSEEARRSFPTELDQVRMVTYESCRGLEGWSVVCWQLDKLYDQKTRDGSVSTDLFSTREHAAAMNAGSWVMIPATRAIDHLVLHVEDPQHPLALILRRVVDSVGVESGALIG